MNRFAIENSLQQNVCNINPFFRAFYARFDQSRKTRVLFSSDVTEFAIVNSDPAQIRLSFSHFSSYHNL
jgi:hypothetical protein